jgi:glycosyltransferase involved in cell wall biosynthesis
LTLPARPLVSIVIPCFEQARYLGEALESAVRQRYARIEIVVVDDGSHDRPEDIVSRYPDVRLIRQENRGPSAARNAGIRASRGEFLVFLDADDRLRPDAVRAGVGRLLQHPDAAFTAGRCQLMDVDGKTAHVQPPHPRREHYDALLRECFIWMPAVVMHRRRSVEAVGGFCARLDAAADYDLYLRVSRASPIDVHDEIVAEYRRHDACMSADPALMLRATLTALSGQREYVAAHPEYARAFRAGRRFWKDFYGSLVVDRLRADIRRSGRRRQALHAAITLARLAPLCLIRNLLRKLHVTIVPSRRRADRAIMQASRVPLTK